MDPWAVAQKTHLVNGTLGYEAQLALRGADEERRDPPFHHGTRNGRRGAVRRVGAALPEWFTNVTGEGELAPTRLPNVKVKNSPLGTGHAQMGLARSGVSQRRRAGERRLHAAGAGRAHRAAAQGSGNPAAAGRQARRQPGPGDRRGCAADGYARRRRPPGSTGNRIKEGQANYLRKCGREAGASEQETCERYGVSRLEI